MLARSSNYESALCRPHQVYTRVDVYSGAGVLLESDLPFIDGTVSATLTSRVARRFSLTLDDEFYPDEIDDLLAPFGNEVRAYRGITYGDGLDEFFPVFRGRINDVDLNDEGQVSLTALDRASDVVAAGFDGPHSSGPDRVTEGFRNLILEALPDAVFDSTMDETIWESYPRMIWESDRGQAADDLADSAAAFWFPTADGTFTMIKVPWTRDTLSLFTLRDGPLGQIERSQASRSRENVFNSVTVYAERVDGSEPVFFTARDDIPTSPSFPGTFGVRAQQISIQAALNEAQARQAAETALRRSKALTETWALEIVPDASIELGDTFTLEARGRTAVQCVAGFSLPMTTEGTMTLECRAQVPEEVQVG